MAIWVQNNNVIVNASGQPVNCADCPCEEFSCENITLTATFSGLDAARCTGCQSDRTIHEALTVDGTYLLGAGTGTTECSWRDACQDGSGSGVSWVRRVYSSGSGCTGSSTLEDKHWYKIIAAIAVENGALGPIETAVLIVQDTQENCDSSGGASISVFNYRRLFDGGTYYVGDAIPNPDTCSSTNPSDGGTCTLTVV